MRFILICIVAFSLSFNHVLAQQAGTIDLSFNTPDNGVYPTIVDNSIRDTHIYPNGDYLIAGEFTQYNGIPVNRILRIDNNGNIVSSFDPGTGPNGNIVAMTVLSNGKIVISGEFTSYNGNPVDSITVLNPDGSQDMTFDLPVSPISFIYAIAEQSTGDVIIGGYYVNGQSPTGLERIKPDGTIDSTFDIGAPANAFLRNIFIDSYDNIYPTGQFDNIGNHTTYGFARLGVDGAVDTTYSIAPEYGTGTYNLIVLDDSSVVASGSYAPSNGNIIYGYFKVTPTGAFDPTFQDAPYWAHCRAFAMDSLGRYYANMDNNQFRSIRRLLADGSIDPDFEEYTYSDNAWTGFLNDIDIEPFTGKILLSGNGLFRRHVDGTKDESFLSPMGANGDVNVVKTLPDNKLLIGGDFSGYDNYSLNGIARLLPDGTVDIGFKPGRGCVVGVTAAESVREVLALEVQNDGKILVGGGFIRFNGETHNRLIRLNADGSIDSTFQIGNGFNDLVKEIVVQPDGKILVSGNFTGYDLGGANPTNCYRIARLNADGSIDATFTSFPGANSFVNAISLQQNGQILIGGNFSTYNGSLASKIALLNPDGTTDLGFSTGYGCNNQVYDLATDDSLKIYVGSSATMYDSTTVNRLFRIFPDGSYDSTYNSSSQFTSGWVKQLQLQNDGKVLAIGKFVGGYSTSYQVGRIDSAGFLDTSFTLAGPSGNLNSFDLYPNGSIAIGGSFTSYNGITKKALARLNNDVPYDSCLFFSAGITSVSSISCFDTAEVTVSVGNGVPPYYYSWDNSGFQLNDTVYTTNTGGVHYISVTDSLNCVYMTGYIINGPSTTSGFDNTAQLIATTFQPGVTKTIIVDAYNDGCLPSSGQVTLVLDSLVEFIGSIPAPDMLSGDSLTWYFTNITYDSAHVTPAIKIKTDTSAVIGDSLTFDLIVSPVVGDFNPLNNNKNYNFAVTASYDPNDKQVYPAGDCVPHFVSMGQKMTYTIRFQNTGSANAINIHIDDSISPYLNLESTRIVACSNEMFTEVLPGNKLRFVFNDIQLPDSASNPDGSIGYVVFEIDQNNSNVFDETEITNQSAIYFDYNAPVITNQVYNTVQVDDYTASISSVTLSECDSLLWNGVYFTSSGIYQYTTQNMYGCDSTIHLNLTLLEGYDSLFVLNAIDSVTFNGTTYYTSTSYQEVYTNQAGCDSTITFQINVGSAGIDENSTENIVIYPNPTDRYLWINNPYKDGTIRLLNETGATILQTEMDQEVLKLDLLGLKAGMYFIQMELVEGMFIHRIIVID